MPKKCADCKCNTNCLSHFGGIGCTYKKQIEEKGRSLSKIENDFGRKLEQ